MGDEEEPPGPRRNPGSYYRSNRQVCQPQSEWAGGKPLASVAGIVPLRYTSLISLRFIVQWIYASLVAHLYLLYEDTRKRYPLLSLYSEGFIPFTQGQDPSPGRGRVVATNDGHRATHGQRSCRAMPPVGAGAEAPVLIQGCVASDGGYISTFSDVAPFCFLTHLAYSSDRRRRAPDPISLRAGVSSLPNY